jgi:hypothetical protein
VVTVMIALASGSLSEEEPADCLRSRIAQDGPSTAPG